MAAPTIDLHYRIQHAAGRTEPLTRLQQHLPPAVEVVTDHETDNPNPMRNYLRCLSDLPSGATHVAVLQDDALPCRNFEARLMQAVGEHPEDLILLFVGGLPTRTRKNFYEALKNGERWSPVYFREIHHVVATVWPAALAEVFLDWYPQTRIPGPIPPRSDDAVVGFFMRKTRRQAWATVPCLVEHPDDYPSTLRSNSRFGDRGRKAIAFADDVEAAAVVE